MASKYSPYIPSVTVEELLQDDDDLPNPHVADTPFLLPSGRLAFCGYPACDVRFIRFNDDSRSDFYSSRTVETWPEARELYRQGWIIQCYWHLVYEHSGVTAEVELKDLRVPISFLLEKLPPLERIPARLVARRHRHDWSLPVELSLQEVQDIYAEGVQRDISREHVLVASDEEVAELERLIDAWREAQRAVRRARRARRKWWDRRPTVAMVRARLLDEQSGR